ncbi:beta-galactosidase [Deinococcus ruber]|uniref:Beta-galactosidase n=1 Tax=Deinococcus ruber TaxID=1848197 RepID=A0A918F2Q5_9DEIO|nr:beta-galactosidase [Deinococcus ruber]GGQ95653.1 beta-galactosidase [Deinococcus ruber]
MTPSLPAPHLTLAVCDYPEHVPRDRWTRYAEQQKALGLSFVRIAEFAWSRMEPRPGEYEWAWLDEAIEAYADAGLKVVLCTPTATPPAWLIRAHPEILPYDREGRIREFGSRRHYDFASPIFREHSRRITRVLAERYGQHPAVVGWQTDNEFGCHDTARSYGGASAAAFPGWLEAKYGTLDALNEAWGNVFWSMEYGDWAQIRLPNLLVTEVNPSHLLDFYRFASDTVASFQAEQVAILRLGSPGRFITHNFMIFETGFDHYDVAKGLDFVSWDNYPTGMLEFFSSWMPDEIKTDYARTGHPDLIAFNHDLYRGLLKRPFWVMEQQCGQVNWAPFNPLPAPGAVQLWTAQAWAHGADTVSYFRWRAATMAQEVMHSGLLRHDETLDRGGLEVESQDLTAMPLGSVPARVALLHDYESLWLYDVQKHAASLSYWAQTVTYYRALRGLGQDVDIVHPDSDLSGYALIVAPALTLMTPERAAHLEAAAQHARVVFGPRSAYRTVSGRTPEDGQPGVLAELLGAKLLNFDSLRPGLSVRVEGPDHACDVQSWAESYRLTGAETLYRYVDGPQSGEAAVIRKGSVTVIGAHSEELLRAVLAGELRAAGLSPEQLPEGVRLSRRAGHTLLQNWTSQTVNLHGRELAPVSFALEAQA